MIRKSLEMLSGQHYGTRYADLSRGLKIIAKGHCFEDKLHCKRVTVMLL
jgi:hypothetical protein